MRRHLILVAALALAGAACGGGTGSTSTTTTVPGTTSTSTATTVATTTTAAATTTTEAAAGEALTVNPDGSYAIDWDALSGSVFFAPAGGGDDPFFQVHNDPAADGFFFSVEAYTVYGAAWSGELGDFEVSCVPAGSGICIHFDPDGPGPLGDLGADFMAIGDVTIVQADADGFVAIFSNLEFSDGTTIPGPFTVTG
jgi:hypothetical protein